MADMITALRSMCNAGTADYTVAGVAYWTDEQLQSVLDKHRTDYIDYSPAPIAQMADGGGSVTYHRYITNLQNWEQTDGGTAILVVRDNYYNVSGTANWSMDYQRGELTFTANTLGLPYTITGRVYDLNRAAAEIWRTKAATVVAASYSWSSDNMRVDKSQLRREYFDMATFYETQAGPIMVKVRRSDEC